MTDDDLTVLAGVDVSRETCDLLQAHLELLRKWNGRINLVSSATLDEAWRRHVADSLQLLPLAPVTAQSWLDLGSGAGFPGMVIAIAAKEVRPGLKVTCVESDRRKAAFLTAVAREAGVPVAIHATRAEALQPQSADVVSARALAPLPRLFSHVERHLANDGVALLPKGGGWREEVTEALESWAFRSEEIPSRTDEKAVILRIGALRRV